MEKAKLKRTILIVFGCLCLFLLVGSIGVSLIERAMQGDAPSEYQSTHIFVTPDYDEDIYQDEGYLDLNRYITFSDGYLATTLTEAEHAEQDDDVRFMIDYIGTIIAGDAEAYNACYSDEYYAEPDCAPLDRFTAQKLYNITLTRTDTETVDGENGYTTHGYRVEYMIRHNNGTFRRDLGSDSIRAQYLVISDREGSWKIDRVITYSYS